MSNPKLNSKSPTIRRILKEAAELANSPSPDYAAAPLETDLFEWHFTLRGPPRSSFAAGLYHGRIVLPATYPLRPPSFRFATPSGRFEANREICLSISGHHEETWQPAWGVRTALVALRAFMETDARGQLGGLDADDAVRRRLAADSPAWRCPVCARSNADIIAESEERCREIDGASAAATEEGEASGSNNEGENGGGSNKPRRQEVEVPAELKLGFRDEMEAKAKARQQADGTGDGTGRDPARKEDEDAESAELAEGFVQTAPVRDTTPPAPQPPPARPVQGVPAPTGRIPLPDPVGRATAPAMQTQSRRRIDPNAGVPVWVDYAIVSLVVVLIAMLMKILVGR
ncbi:UBC-like protein [Hypoxylon sp. FL1284]|nr:UBC-like protein [Hypoxylon sp. FL1284]